MGATNACSNPPFDTNRIPTVLPKINCGVHHLFGVLVGEPESERPIDLVFMLGLGLSERYDQISPAPVVGHVV
jgi:hypothetical protein